MPDAGYKACPECKDRFLNGPPFDSHPTKVREDLAEWHDAGHPRPWELSLLDSPLAAMTLDRMVEACGLGPTREGRIPTEVNDALQLMFFTAAPEVKARWVEQVTTAVGEMGGTSATPTLIPMFFLCGYAAGLKDRT